MVEMAYKKSMKLLLATRFFDMRNAGIGRVSSEIRARLVQRGHDVTAVSSQHNSLHGYAWYTMCSLWGEMHRRYDAYHAMTPVEGIHAPPGKSVATFYDLILLTHPEHAGAGVGYSPTKLWIAQQYFEFACKRAARARYVACISDYTREQVIERLHVPERKVGTIRLGIRPDMEPRPKQDNIYRIGYLGQLDRRKRVALLINAFRKANIDAELVIGGIGVDEAKLRAVAGNDPRIKFLGFIPDERLVNFFNSLTVFAFPTSIEGWGLPIVEAFACNVPVVVMADAIIPPELKSRCYVTDDLAWWLKEVTPDNIGWQADNYEYAKSHSWDRCVDEYEQLYREIVD